jgi:hypothetical protein
MLQRNGCPKDRLFGIAMIPSSRNHHPNHRRRLAVEEAVVPVVRRRSEHALQILPMCLLD